MNNTFLPRGYFRVINSFCSDNLLGNKKRGTPKSAMKEFVIFYSSYFLGEEQRVGRLGREEE